MRFFTSPKFLLITLLGFFSGLPLALTASTLTAWLADAKVDRASIGLFAAVATPYALKFLWAPLVDGLRIPFLTARLGRRRSWLLVTQALLALALVAMAGNDPATSQWLTALFAVIVATLSATQDIVIDAYRVELLAPLKTIPEGGITPYAPRGADPLPSGSPEATQRKQTDEQGMGAACITFGYRIGMLVSGAGALYLADRIGWHGTYMAMAGVMAAGLLLTLLARESSADEVQNSEKKRSPATFLRDYIIMPFRDFMTRPMWLGVLAFVVLYKLGDAFMGTMFNPFLLDLGFTKTEIAKVVKFYGLIATIAGTFAGGWMVARIGMFRTLMLAGFTHMLTNFLLIVQARLGADIGFLTVSIVAENFTGGMSTAAFIAYLSALCKVNYTATQYALLSSLAAFGRTWLSTPSGWLSKTLGWEGFFAVASLMAVPGLALLVWLEKQKKRVA